MFEQYSTPSPLSVSVASVIIGDQNVEHSSDSTYVPVPIPVFETEPALNVQSDSYHEASKQQIRPRIGSGRPAYPLVEHPEIMIEYNFYFKYVLFFKNNKAFKKFKKEI